MNILNVADLMLHAISSKEVALTELDKYLKAICQEANNFVFQLYLIGRLSRN